MENIFTTILGYVTQFTTELFSVGTALANWITATPLALIGFILSIVYFLVNGIRGFFRGV